MHTDTQTMVAPVSTPTAGGPAPDYIAIGPNRHYPSPAERPHSAKALTSRGNLAATNPRTHPARTPYDKNEHLYNRTKRKRESSLQPTSPGVTAEIPGVVTPTAVWNTSRRVYSPGVVGLHEEIEDFFQWMTPTPQEHQVRMEVILKMEKVIQNEWRDARVHVLGSCKSGLYLPSSDIDLVVFGKWAVIPFRTIEQRLVENGLAEPSTIKILDKASVPIVKYVDKDTQISVDISFNMACGIQTAELIKFFKKKFPPLSKLAYVLKQFLRQRDLNEVFTGGLSTYALILLIVSFLQMHPRRNAAHAHNANLGVLLIEFLELFGKLFNYVNTAIIITDGGSWIPKASASHGGSVICILDPLDADSDVGRSSYGYMAVKQAFEKGHCDLITLLDQPSQNLNGKSILSQIVDISDEDLKYRDWIQTKFRNIPDAECADPTLPSRLPITESRNVEPKQLPVAPKDPPTSSKAQSDKCSSPGSDGRRSAAHSSRLTPSAEGISAKMAEAAANEDSDSVCSVSSEGGRSSLMSAGSCPENRSSSDTDSDIMASHPSASPTSAMSISPASSEVGSIKSSLSRVSGKSSKPGSTRSSTVSVTKKSTYWVNGSKVQDRADRDLNWRSHCDTDSPPATLAPLAPSRAPVIPKVGAVASGKADQDPNWRNHRSEDEAPNGSDVPPPPNAQSIDTKDIWSRTNSPVKSHFHGKSRKSRKNQDKKDLQDVVTNPGDAPPGDVMCTSLVTTASSSELVSAKERLTAGLDNSNHALDDKINDNHQNNNGSVSSTTSSTPPTTTKAGRPKRRRRKNASNSDALRPITSNGNLNLREKESNHHPHTSAKARFSHGSGLFEPQR